MTMIHSDPQLVWRDYKVTNLVKCYHYRKALIQPVSTRTVAKDKDDHRRVCFDSQDPLHYVAPAVYETVEVEELWYSRTEYKQMKQELVDYCRRLQVQDRAISTDPYSCKAILVKAYQACRDASKEDRSTCLLDPLEEAYLRKWLSKGHRLGVEQIPVLVIQADKVSRRKRVVTAVLEAQEASVALGTDDADATAARLRDIALNISRPSTLWAWRVAYKQAPKPSQL